MSSDSELGKTVKSTQHRKHPKPGIWFRWDVLPGFTSDVRLRHHTCANRLKAREGAIITNITMKRYISI